MADFDFIRSTDLRACLNSDYGELQTVLDAGAYKASLVLAGSIVEAILCDYLLAHSPRGGHKKDPAVRYGTTETSSMLGALPVSRSRLTRIPLVLPRAWWKSCRMRRPRPSATNAG